MSGPDCQFEVCDSIVMHCPVNENRLYLDGPMLLSYLYIGIAPIMQLPMYVIKIVTFKGGHLMW